MLQSKRFFESITPSETWRSLLHNFVPFNCSDIYIACLTYIVTHHRKKRIPVIDVPETELCVRCDHHRAISDSNFLGAYLLSGILCVVAEPFPKNWEGNSTFRKRTTTSGRWTPQKRNYITFSFFIHVVEMKIIFLSSFWIDDTFSTEVTHPHTHPPHQHRRDVHVKFVGEIFLKFVFFRRSPNRRRMNSN